MAAKQKTITIADAARERLARYAARLGINASAAIAEALRLADLPDATYAQISALALDLDQDVRDILIQAVQALYEREIGTPERDVLAELDDLRARVDALAAEQNDRT